MFDRVRIKENAKTALRRRYWIVVLAAVIVGLLGGSLAGGLTDSGSVKLTNRLEGLFEDNTDIDTVPDAGVWDPDMGAANPWEDYGDGYYYGDDDYADGEDMALGDIWATFKQELNTILEDFSREIGVDLRTGIAVIAGVVIAILLIAVLFALLLKVLVGNVMTVGGHGWMLRHLRGEDVGVGEVFAAFRIYKPTVVTMLVRGIYVWLWSLLFVIPGIIAGYAYSMVPYIIYENPNLTANQAIALSRKMTKGYKFDLFVLNLSFIGWVFLSAITGGIVGIFWSNPYMGLTHAGVYEDLKWKAIQAGKLTWADFGQLPPPAADPIADVWGTPATQAAWDNTETPAEPAPTVWNNPTDVRW